MPSQDWKPSEHPFIIPYLYVRDAEAAAEFYSHAFGFKLEFSRPGPGGKPIHVEMSWHSGRLMMAPDGAWDAPQKSPATTGGPSPMNLYIYVPNVDATFHKALEGGAQPLGQPEDSFWGDRIAAVMCPDGYVWTFATKVGEFDPSKGPQLA